MSGKDKGKQGKVLVADPERAARSSWRASTSSRCHQQAPQDQGRSRAASSRREAAIYASKVRWSAPSAASRTRVAL
ncbi:MAG: hypothetical protein ACLUNO_05835 [Oscillospiraceae bacterium]